MTNHSMVNDEAHMFRLKLRQNWTVKKAKEIFKH